MSGTAPKKAKPGNRRKTGKEQYFTPSDLAGRLVAEVVKATGDLKGRTVLEPALSIPFFNHAAKVSDTIAFIVPQSWRKWSVINRLDRNFHLVEDHDLQIDYVDSDDNPLMERRHLSTCFQIWQRRDELRPIIRVEDRGIIEKCKPEQADVALVIFGFSCGTVLTEFERVKNTTRMFLKLKHPRALEALQSVDYSAFFRNTAYTPALALPEINFLLNEFLFGEPNLRLTD